MLPLKIQQFLDSLFIRYVVHSNVKSKSNFPFAHYAESIDAAAIKVVLFSDERGPVLVAFSAKDGLDFEALNQETGRNLTLDSGHKYKHQLSGFSVRNLPPFGRLFQMPMIVDETLLEKPRYLIDIGKSDIFLELGSRDFNILFKGSQRKQLSKPVNRQLSNVRELKTFGTGNVRNKLMTENTEKLLSQDTVKAKFSKSIDLPILPQVGKQLVELKSRESFDLVDLVDLIERDPVISAKIISYASSPFFSYQGKLDSVQEAVFHVLGVDLSMNIALALAMGHEFNGPLNGPLGAMAVWRHGVYCATLSQAIASKISGVANVKPGTAYLYGLLHNIGFLALGHMFPEQFATFNRMVESKPDVSISVLEKQILGVSHTMVGGLLMGSWNLPEDFKTIIENHHNYDINSNEQVYAHIIHIANVMLKTINIGDAGDPYLPEELIEKYKLKEGELQRLLENVSRWNESLDSLAQQMVA